MWYFVQHDIQQGPVSLEEIQSLIAKGTITSATLVWKRGMDNWLAIAESELKDLLPDEGPPPIPVDNPPPIPNIRRTENATINGPRIELGGLLSDSFNYVGSVYTSMLVFFAPSLFISLLIAFALVDGSVGTFLLLSLISSTCVLPFVSGASIFYVQRNLTQQGVTIADSMQRASEKFTQLVLATFLLWLILIPASILIIPGIYLSIRLSFIYYALMIENRGAVDALSRSWSLTKGYWGQIFLAFLMLGLVVLLPAFILGAILGAIFGQISLVISQSMGGFIGLIIGPIIAVYYVFLFMSLVNLASERSRDGRYI